MKNRSQPYVAQICTFKKDFADGEWEVLGEVAESGSVRCDVVSGSRCFSFFLVLFSGADLQGLCRRCMLLPELTS